MGRSRTWHWVWSDEERNDLMRISDLMSPFSIEEGDVLCFQDDDYVVVDVNLDGRNYLITVTDMYLDTRILNVPDTAQVAVYVAHDEMEIWWTATSAIHLCLMSVRKYIRIVHLMIVLWCGGVCVLRILLWRLFRNKVFRLFIKIIIFSKLVGVRQAKWPDGAHRRYHVVIIDVRYVRFTTWLVLWNLL